MKQPLFEVALKELPDSIAFDPIRMKTLDDLIFACLIQLDLISEGQDGTENDNPKPIRRWLSKWQIKT